MPGHKPAATRDYSFHCRINYIHCAEATLKTSIIILVIDNHNKNPAVLAIKDLNNITWFENRFLPYKPVYPCTYDTCYDDVMMMYDVIYDDVYV